MALPLQAPSDMRRVLFVDDDQNLLQALSNSLRRYRKQWDMSFILGGRAALEALAAGATFDAVVSDARMPDVGGEALLTEVQRLHPDTTRFILSGQTDEGSALRLLHVAHQFIAKPCESTALFDLVENTCARRELLANDALRALFTQIGALPALPATFLKVTALLNDPDCGAADVAAVIEEDPALSGEVLRAVNSAFYGLPKKMVQVRQATSYLGLETVRALVLSVELAQSFTRAGLASSLVHRVFSERSLRAAHLARRLTKQCSPQADADAAFTACLLMDVGQLVFAERRGGDWLPLFREAGGDGARLATLERERLGCDHGAASAYLWSLWGLPAVVIGAVATHHGPLPADATAEQRAVFVASACVEAKDVQRLSPVPGLEPLYETARRELARA
jgi:HD-like signal output (HDOD) protein